MFALENKHESSLSSTDRRNLTNTHRQYYLSPPLTPFPHFPSYKDNPEPSPELLTYQPMLPGLQEKLPHENRQRISRISSKDEERFKQPSALQQQPKRERKEIMEQNSGSTYRTGRPMTDPTQ